MDSLSNPFSGDDLLPADDIALLPSRDSEWLPPRRTLGVKIRRLRFLAAWVAMATLGATIIWSLTWIQPQSSVSLSLVGASYLDNLSVDLNIHGWNNLTQLRGLAQDSKSHDDNHFQLLKPPAILNSQSRWDLDWDSTTENTLVVFVSAHGAADEKGPYLLADDASPENAASRLFVTNLLKRMKQVPAHKKKLLVLDATHFAANWEYGILSNDFARAMIELNQAVIDVPNLVVLCASSTDQLSWQATPWNQTAFGHFFTEGLRGAAVDLGNDGRIDAGDLYYYTHSAVSNWVKTNLQRVQQPMLLPIGDLGLERAAAIELNFVNPGYQPSEPVVFNTKQNSHVRKIWDGYETLLKQPLHPGTCSLARWRRYEKTILRYEQLVQAGEMKAANGFVEEINALHQKIEWEQHQRLAAEQGSLTIGPAVFSRIVDDSRVSQITDQLWTATSGQHGAIWRTSLATADEPAALRVAVLSKLYERAMSDPAKMLHKANSIIEYVLDPIESPPSEINFLQVLAHSLPAHARQDDNANLIRQALQVRLLAEQTAVSWQPGAHAYSEDVFPWIVDRIVAADEQRLLGEDLLFADSEERQRAADYLNRATELYRLAIASGNSVRSAFDTQSQLFRVLPHLVQWISRTSEQLSPTERERIVKFEALLREAHVLNAMLESPEATTIDQAPRSANGSTGSLIEQTQLVSKMFGSLKFHFDNWWKHQISESHVSSWHHVELALSLPYGSSASRFNMIQQRAKMGHHDYQTESSSTVALSEVATSEFEQQRSTVNTGQVNGRLALAMIGKRGYDFANLKGVESFAQVNHRVRVFDVEERWWESLYRAGRDISNCLNRLTQFSQPKTKSESRTLSIEFAASINGLLGASNQTNQENCPSILQRQRRQSMLFAGMAQRSLNGRWFGPDNQPYYLDAARRYLRCAERLWPENPKLSSLADRVSPVSQLALDNPERIDLTTETRIPFQIGIKKQRADGGFAGLPVLWIQQSDNLDIIRPRMKQRLVQQLTAGKSPSLESCLLENPIVRPDSNATKVSQLLVNPVSFQRFAADDNMRTIQVAGFFRGQTLSSEIEVRLHRTPDLFRVQHQRPANARVAVVAPDPLHGLYGTGAGALAIVIDASGSMGASANRKFDQSTKYYEATRALRDVLQSLPDGIQLSVWIFGQAVGPGKTVRHAEQTINRVVEPIVWNTADTDQLESLMHNVSYPNVEPWNESPIVEALLAAKQDVLGERGNRSVLLLTDGRDNRYQFTALPVADPATLVPDSIRAAFDHSGVVLNVVGFKVENREAEQSRAQFQIVESFSPPGKYFEVSDARLLAETLKSILHQRVRYWIDDFANHPINGERRQYLEVGRQHEGGQWYPEELAPSNYSLWTNANADPFRFQVNRGDQLVIELSRQGKGLQCATSSYLNTLNSDRPCKRVAGWDVAALENRLVGSNQLSLLLGIEKSPSNKATSVEVVRPFDVWFEVQQRGARQSDHPTVWYSNYEFPVPAWRVDVDSWPRRAGLLNEVAIPSVSIWWTPDRWTPAAVRFERGRDYRQLSELVGRRADVDGESIVIREARVENRSVEISEGVRKTKPCLVVQLKHSLERRLWIRPQGIEFEGREDRFYEKTGQYTGIFWPVTADELNSAVSALEIVSLSDLKREAKSKGCYIRLDHLTSPRADDVAFPPLTGFSKFK